MGKDREAWHAAVYGITNRHPQCLEITSSPNIYSHVPPMVIEPQCLAKYVAISQLLLQPEEDMWQSLANKL